MTKPPERKRPKWRRRLGWVVSALLIAVIAAVAALPWLLGTTPVRRAILAQVNQMYAPTVIELDDLAASWTSPLQLKGVVLRDGNGKAVVTSPTATLNRSLWQLVTLAPDYGTLTLHGAYVDIERHEDGSIDLAEALGPILEGDDDEADEDDGGPETGFVLAIEGGSLLLKSPELAEPMTAKGLEMTLHCAPSPLTWEIALANPEARRLEVSGRYGSDDPLSSEIVVEIAGSRWPLALSQSGLLVETIFDGTVGLRIDGDLIESKGDAVLTAVSAGGPILKGDHPTFERIEAGWDVSLAGDGISLRRIDIDAPFATVGLAPDAPAGASKWVGRVDLAALVAKLPNTLALREGLTLDQGTADVEAVFGPVGADGATPVVASARIADLSARDGARVVTMSEPVTVSARVLQTAGSAVSVESASFSSSFLKAEGQGDLDQGVTVKGSVNLVALDSQLRDWVDLGEIALSGIGRFGGDYRREPGGATFTTRLAIEGQSLRVAGLTEEPIARDMARIDLIVQGPAAPPGLPTGWTTVHFSARTEGVDAIIDISPVGDALALKGSFAIPQTAPAVEGQPLPEPTSLLFDASYRSADDRLELASLEARHAMGRIIASGRIDQVSAARLADLTGTVEPDWNAVSVMVAEATEPNARIEGTPRTFRLSGPLSGGSTEEILSGLDAELGVDVTGAVLFGMDLGPAPILVRCAQGDVQIVPIDTTLSGGRVVLRPDIELHPDGLVLLTMAEGSGLDGVEITDDVSRGVLAYIAPMLREATQVNGKVSARLDRLAVPLAGPETGEAPPVDLAARLAFQQVTYGPGAMTQSVLGMAGLTPEQTPRLSIDQVVNVAITNGRVYQSGLEVNAAEGVALQLEGSVGLDQTLALKVGVPLSDRLLGGQEVLSGVLGGTRVGLPIGGTLSDPVLDREAFRLGLKQQGGRLLSRGAAAGAGQLLRMLNEDGQPLSGAGAESADSAPIAPPAEEVLRGLGRGLLRDVIGGFGGGQP